MMNEILDHEYIFDSMSADMFVQFWNYVVREYGSISLSDVLDEQLLLGQFERSREMNKYIFNNYGWKRAISDNVFEERKINGFHRYVLKLPECEEL